MNISFENEVEQLEYEIAGLKKVSQDPAFSQYLCSVESRLIGNPQITKALRLEMIKNYNTYVDRMRVAGVPTAPNYHEAIYPGMEAPKVFNSKVVKQQVDNIMQAQTFDSVANIPFDNDANNNQQPIDSVQIQTIQPMPIQPVPAQTISMQQAPMQQAPMQQAPMQQAPMQQAPMQQAPMQFVHSQPAPAQRITNANANLSNSQYANNNVVTKNRAEFAIGAIVLSVLGTILILTGAIMMAVNFFDATWQGISLYAVCIALFLFSELFIRRFVDKLSAVLTSLSIGGAFVVTLVNFFALNIYNLPVTLVLLIVLSIAVGVYSHFRNSFLFSLIGYFASFTSLSLIFQASSSAEIYMIYGIILASGLLWAAFPLKKNGRAFAIIQVFTSIFLVFWFTPTVSGFYNNNDYLDWLRCLILVAVSYTLLSVMVLINGIRYFKESDGAFDSSYEGALTFYKIMYIFANVVYTILFLLCSVIISMDSEYGIVGMAICGSAIIVPNAIVAYVLYAKKSSMWMFCAFSAAFAGATCLGWNTKDWGGLIACFLIMAVVSVLSYIKKTTGFYIVDLLLKIYLFFIMLTQSIVHNEAPYIVRYVCIAGIILAIGLAVGYKLPIQIMMTGLLTFNVCSTIVSDEYIPAVIVLILAIAVALFHNVKWLKSRNMYPLDILVWITLLIVTTTLYIPMYRDELVTVVLTMVFGLAIMIQYYFKRYETFMAGKMLPLGLFITAYIPIFRMENIVVSIILMSLALMCVALGFIFKQKGIRIYGLVLAILVCAKIGFYDFWSADSLIKTVMFFIVGILSLIIAGVYIVVEKKMSKQDKVD